MHPSAVTLNPATGRNYTYDAKGNMLTRGNQSLVWDIDNRVASIAMLGIGTTLMEYDYSGVRVKKNAPSGISLYQFQGYEIEPNGTITKFIKTGIESFASKRGTSKYFYHNDHLGSVNVITDISGTRVQLNKYDPWGGVSRSLVTFDPTHRFTGKELDPESGLYYYGGRYYDQEISRFVSPDPFIQAPHDPQSLNRYSYVVNNPQNYIDPSGYFFKKLFKSIKKIFKNIIENPAVFVASVVVGVVTGGIGFAATGSWVLAGAVGGAAAGITSAGMTGGNIWQGGLIGFVGGAVGGGVFGSIGGGAVTLGSVSGGAFAGGATTGALNTAFNGGNFLVNTFAGGISSTATAAAFHAVGQFASSVYRSSQRFLLKQETDSVLSYAMAGGEMLLCDACISDAEVRLSPQVLGTIKDALKWIFGWKIEGASAGYSKYGTGRLFGIFHRPTGLNIQVHNHPLPDTLGENAWHFHYAGQLKVASILRTKNLAI